MLDTPAARRWSALIDRQEQAGLSNQEFATRNNLNPGTLAWWRWKLRRSRARTSPFLAVVVKEPRALSNLELLLDQGQPRIVVTANTNLDLLRTVVAALC